jgi:hypothetical protein
MVVTIMRWTGREARILRETALRMSIRDFAAHTQLSPYAIRDFETKGETANLRVSTQKILDTTLAAAPDDAQQRFASALDSSDGHTVFTGEAATTGVGVPSPRSPGRAELRWLEQLNRRNHDPDEPLTTTTVAEPWNRLAYALATPASLDGQTVEHLQGQTRDFFNREEHIPSRQLAAELSTHIAQITRLVAEAPTRFRRTLMASLGEALALAAWLAWDSGEAATLQRRFEQAAEAAREAGDGPLLACTRAYRSYFAEAAGDLPAAQDLLASGQSYARSECNAGTRSWLAAREAEVAAALRDRTAALRALERSLTAYDYAHPYHERPWTSFFTPSRLGSMVITTYAYLDHPDLDTTAEAVIGSVPTAEVKARAIILADLAAAALKRGEFDQGAELGHRALNQTLTQEVTVARQHLRQLHATIVLIPATPALTVLDQRLVAHVM